MLDLSKICCGPACLTMIYFLIFRPSLQQTQLHVVLSIYTSVAEAGGEPADPALPLPL